ncbi:glutamate synthase large subunit [Halococcus sp. IIIV-5B]|uniref:glutamate synthase large subunit n=1 Tax=Halococcus sp. IIIV-5B TaxID=2321230 RepID=UPI000E738E42|nr:glutamate synthase large subunit [Halococcus sp. IIIV-5B]RJS98085.1 glutamate synthase large subunit [Halococcus sp. IIIV-5B]
MATHHPSGEESAATLVDPTEARSNCGVGVVMDLDGGCDHSVVADSLDLLANLEHRGTTGAEENTGDGAGIMLQTPHDFFADELDVDLPETYAVGSVFFPRDDAARRTLQELFEDRLADHGLSVRHWRDVPTDNADLGKTALDAEPDSAQAFVVPDDDIGTEAFDHRLYVARRAVEQAVAEREPDGEERFYICSLDRQTLVYKGLLKGDQIADYYPDLTDARIRSTFVLVHARFSTNTLGAWHLAHPYRNVIHNGEINTIQGNVNWMRARENDIRTDEFDIDAVRPVIADPEQSDTASVDNALELLLQGGRDLPHALRLLIPEAFRGEEHQMSDERRAFYDYHASLSEPWDGPALVAATDGERVGAVLDRNGFRPCRYDITTDNRLVMASEAGALDLDPAEIEERGRLEPGQLFVADPEAGRVVPDEEAFESLTDEKYAEWVGEEQVQLDDLAGDAAHEHAARDAEEAVDDLRSHQALYGYTYDELDNLLEPMATKGKDPVGSMGDDTPLSVLSQFNRPLFTYFRQLFAQVTNPPLDYIREELVTSLETRLGNQHNLLGETRAHARQLVSDSPILTDAQTEAIKSMNGDANGLTSATVDITYEADGDLETAVERVREDASVAADDHDIVVLSDRAASESRKPIPSLLATAAVHHHLVRNGLRNRAGLVVESADPRAVHHIATLVGYGAGAINPYLAYQTIADLTAGGDGAELDAAIGAYIEALEDGLLKTMSKMGISTVQSYQGAQIFEAVGVNSAFVAEYFEGTPSRTGGIGIEDVEEDLADRHTVAFSEDPQIERQGEYEHRSGGIFHEWNPKTVGALQQAVRRGDYEQYGEFAELMNNQQERLQSLRGLLEFDSDRESVPVDEVEPVTEIVKRFSTAAMSLGSLSPEMHENNAVAMHRLGGKSNTGEGGEPPERFGTEKECNVKQVASGRFGVTSEYLTSADELQIKMAQGSKPGEGGHLPGKKVNEMIAHVRHATPGVGLISPPPLHDIYSIEDLKQLIHDLKAANPEADINVKLVSEAGIGTIAAGVAKANADVVHISGHSGGTGASPRTSIKNAGVPWELGLAETNQMLRETRLRSRIRVSTDGGLKTGRDVAVAALLGAEEYIFGTSSLVTSGCVMARQCHENTCPVGVATQREELRERFSGEPDHVINYMTFIAQELRELMAELGFTTVEEMVGRPSFLAQREDVSQEKARKVDLSAVLAEPRSDGEPGTERTKVREQTHEIDEQLDHEIVADAEEAIEAGQPVSLNYDISNVDRAVGALLSNRISREHGGSGLGEDTIRLGFDGTAGQSFGAFLASGVTMDLTGTANDYVGKGLSGGKLVLETPPDAAYEAAENSLIGNVALYGATEGEAYINGKAGERFAVRNSGVTGVVESVGDHGCEYMTGGAIAVLGSTGKNFAAGMSGGVAYVLDPDDEFDAKVNHGMVSTSRDLDRKDEAMLRRLVENHVAYTDSERGAAVLDDWEDVKTQFVKVMPDAYADAIAEREEADVRTRPPAQASAASGEQRVAEGGAD